MGWKPTIELRQGMNEMAEWGKKYKDQLVNMSTDYLMMP